MNISAPFFSNFWFDKGGGDYARQEDRLRKYIAKSQEVDYYPYTSAAANTSPEFKKFRLIAYELLSIQKAMIQFKRNMDKNYAGDGDLLDLAVTELHMRYKLRSQQLLLEKGMEAKLEHKKSYRDKFLFLQLEEKDFAPSLVEIARRCKWSPLFK